MIASNFRRFSEALGLQLPLPFGRLLIWHTSRPTTRWGRRMRKVRGELAALVGRIVRPPKPAYCAKRKDHRVTVQLSLLREAWEDVADEACKMLDSMAAMQDLEDRGQLRLALH